MEIINSGEFTQFTQQPNLKIIKYGRPLQPKVFEKNDVMTKLFYPKNRWLSSNLIKPQALRFRDNVTRLRKKGCIVPEITRIQYCHDLKIYLIHYKKIIGENVRSLAMLGQWMVVDKAAKLVAELHQKGIYFRSIHLENLLHQPNENFALIDITDVSFKLTSLSVYKRYRNLLHLFTMYEDKEIWQQYGIERFLSHYLQHARLNSLHKLCLRKLLYKKL